MDEKRKAQERLEVLLLEGLEGEEVALDDDGWAAIRREAAAKVQAQRKLS